MRGKCCQNNAQHEEKPMRSNINLIALLVIVAVVVNVVVAIFIFVAVVIAVSIAITVAIDVTIVLAITVVFVLVAVLVVSSRKGPAGRQSEWNLKSSPSSKAKNS